MTGSVLIIPCWELYCDHCGWSSVGNSFAEAEDLASAHELTHQAAA